MPKLTVLIVDDEERLLRPWRYLLLNGIPEIDLHTGASYPEGEQEVNDLDTIHVALLDQVLPGGSGIVLYQMVRKKHPAAGVRLISAHFNDKVEDELAALGIKTLTKEELISEGIVHLVERLSRDAGPREREVEQYAEIYNLTPAEKQVAHRIVAGESFKVIASNLGISVRTVHTHAGRIYRKGGVFSRHELAAAVSRPADV
jgi:DNA-binding NarL/FixJ family response regulator